MTTWLSVGNLHVEVFEVMLPCPAGLVVHAYGRRSATEMEAAGAKRGATVSASV